MRGLWHGPFMTTVQLLGKCLVAASLRPIAFAVSPVAESCANRIWGDTTPVARASTRCSDCVGGGASDRYKLNRVLVLDYYRPWSCPGHRMVHRGFS